MYADTHVIHEIVRLAGLFGGLQIATKDQSKYQNNERPEMQRAEELGMDYCFHGWFIFERHQLIPDRFPRLDIWISKHTNAPDRVMAHVGIMEHYDMNEVDDFLTKKIAGFKNLCAPDAKGKIWIAHRQAAFNHSENSKIFRSLKATDQISRKNANGTRFNGRNFKKKTKKNLFG